MSNQKTYSLEKVRAATIDDGYLKAWITDIKIEESEAIINIECFTGISYVETFKMPDFAWRKGNEFVDFINDLDVDLELFNAVEEYEVLYNPEKSHIKASENVDFDVNNHSENEVLQDYIELKQNTIDGEWVKGKIYNIESYEEKTYLGIELPLSGKIIMEFDSPQVWDTSNKIVCLCDSLNVASGEHLIGEEIAIKKIHKNDVDNEEISSVNSSQVDSFYDITTPLELENNDGNSDETKTPNINNELSGPELIVWLSATGLLYLIIAYLFHLAL